MAGKVAIVAAAACVTACQAPNFGKTFDGLPPPVAAGGTDDGSTGGSDGDGDGNPTSGGTSPGSTTNNASATNGNPSGNDATGNVSGSGGTDSASASAGESGTSGPATGDGSGSGGSVSFLQVNYDFTTMAFGGEYDPDHIVAVWVEQGGQFVRTLEVHGSERMEHLIAWRGSSGENVVDAMTGATIENGHGPLSGVWNLLDSTGAVAAPGDYALKIEITADDSNGSGPAGPVFEMPFTVGGPGFDETPAGNAGISTVHIWSE